MTTLDESPNTVDVTETSDEESGALAYRVYLNDERSRVLFDHPAPLDDLAQTVSHLLRDLEELELEALPDEAQLQALVQAVASEDEPVCGGVLIEAEPSTPSRNGHLEWERDFFAEGWAVDEESDTIDYWQRAENRCVTEGEPLARLTPAVAGIAGTDVYGNKIDVAKPEAVKLRAGKGVTIVQQGDVSVYCAEIDGRVCFNDDTVTIDNLLLLPEVGISTGNVDHTGSLMVEGDVRAGATIRVGGDIVIKGLVEPCTIECEGSLSVAGGIIGDSEQSIEVGGDLEARYIKEALISVLGDVKVEGEVSHCQLEAMGVVDVSNGRIAGGRVSGRKGIKVGIAGSVGSTVTRLIAGVDHMLQGALEEQKALTKHAEQHLAMVETALTNAEQNTDAETAPLERVLLALHERREELIEEVNAVRVNQAHLIDDANAGTVKQVAVFKEIWSGTFIQLGEYTTKVIKSVQQPRLVKVINHKVKVLPMGENNQPKF